MWIQGNLMARCWVNKCCPSMAQPNGQLKTSISTTMFKNNNFKSAHNLWNRPFRWKRNNLRTKLYSNRRINKTKIMMQLLTPSRSRKLKRSSTGYMSRKLPRLERLRDPSSKKKRVDKLSKHLSLLAFGKISTMYYIMANSWLLGMTKCGPATRFKEK